MKAIVRKEVHLPEPQAKLLDKAAKASKVSLKLFMERVLIKEANRYERKILSND
jgi:uncharacterized protein (DUF1778 family)